MLLQWTPFCTSGTAKGKGNSQGGSSIHWSSVPEESVAAHGFCNHGDQEKYQGCQEPRWSQIHTRTLTIKAEVCVSPQESPRNEGIPHFYPENTTKSFVIRPSILPSGKPRHLALCFLRLCCKATCQVTPLLIQPLRVIHEAQLQQCL